MEALPVALVTDLHLGFADPQLLVRLGALLDRIKGRASSLVILGDLFDLWVGAGMENWPPVSPLIEFFKRASLPIHFLPGNRDFLLSSGFFEAAGIKLIPEETVREVAGSRWLLLHGDQLCTADLAYQRIRRLLHSPPIRLLARILPLGLRLSVATWLRRRSLRAVARKNKDSMLPTAAGVLNRIDDGGVDGIICGHLHTAMTFSREVDTRPILYVLPPWCDGGNWALLEKDGPRLLDAQGKDLTWPTPTIL